MAKSKQKPSKTKKKQSKSIVAKVRGFSFGRLLTFALIFASIGALLLYQSHAAPTNMEPAQKHGIAGANLLFVSGSERRTKLDDMKNIGVKWLKVDINWATIQPNGPGDGYWGAYDALINDARARGMRILGVITYTPKWALPAGVPSGDLAVKSRYEHYAPRSETQYAEFARKVAVKYAVDGRVRHFEIWNEANNDEFFTLLNQNERIPKYVGMLRKAKNSIKGVYSGSVIISSGLAPYGEVGQSSADKKRINPVTFLAAMYYAGAKGSFDAVGWHPYNWNSGAPGQNKPWNAWHQMYGTNPSARSFMTANGDGDKRIWMTEWGYASEKTGGSITDAWGQADYLSRGYRNAKSYNWAGPLFWFSYEDGVASPEDPGNIYNKFGLVYYFFGKKVEKPTYHVYKAESGAN